MRPRTAIEAKRHQKTFTISYEVLEYLKTCYNKSLTVDESVKATLGYREWAAEQKKLKREGKQVQLI